MVTVFLSHSSADKPFVCQLAEDLRLNTEIDVWRDEEEINPGDNFVSRINTA